MLYLHYLAQGSLRKGNIMTVPVVLFFAVVLFVFVLRAKSRKNAEETLMIERFKARFDVNPRSTHASKIVVKKITQLRDIAARGTTDDMKELELALKVAKQYGFAQ